VTQSNIALSISPARAGLFLLRAVAGSLSTVTIHACGRWLTNLPLEESRRLRYAAPVILPAGVLQVSLQVFLQQRKLSLRCEKLLRGGLKLNSQAQRFCTP
jgi:hypothetical protein